LHLPTFVDRTLRVRSLIGSTIRRFILAKQKAGRHSNCVTEQACPQSDCPTKMIRTYQKNPLAKASVYPTFGKRCDVEIKRLQVVSKVPIAAPVQISQE
jgi:hypothetical protein